eukprot:434262_1
MAEEKKQKDKVYKISVLCLLCPGKGSSYGNPRMIASATNKKNHNLDIPKHYIYNSVNLYGCSIDNATLTKFIKRENTAKRASEDLIICYYKSMQSCCDAQLKVSTATNRIKAWLEEDDVREHMFYFSGHGNQHGIGFSDGLLSFNQLASCFKTFGTNNRQMGDSYRIYIDACGSGAAIDAFNGVSPPGQYGTVLIYTACKKNEASVDQGADGGWFTRQVFAKNSCAYGTTVIHEVSDGKKVKKQPQTPQWKAYRM